MTRLNLKTIRGVIADMDGVLWRGGHILPGASAFFQYLEGHIPYVFATNNSTRTVEYYVARLRQIGITVNEEQIVTSSIATADYLSRHYPPGTQVFVVGEKGLKEALQHAGFTLLAAPGGHPKLVVAGLDRTLTYDKLRTAAMHIRAGATFIGTNPDKTFPDPAGLAPGAGSVIAFLTTAAGQPPALIMGKPGKPMFESALQRLGTVPEHTLMLGDRLDTDILGAKQLGIKTALLLTGVTSESAIMIDSDIQADAVYPDLAALLVDFRKKDSL